MARDRDPFGLALDRLRSDLRDGRIQPGEVLTTTDIAASLKISATPVREAISRLIGEGLLQDRRGRGACALRYVAAEVEELYLLHGACIGLALDFHRKGERSDRSPPVEAMGPSPPSDLRDRTERFWSRLARAADGDPLVRVHRQLADQLAVLRLAEPIVLADVQTELEDLARLAQSNPAQLPEAAKDYHRRREAASRALSAAVREQSSTGAI